MSSSVFQVGTTPAQISLPPVVRAVLVENSSGGLGDKVGAPSIVVDNTSTCSLNPQVGCMLHPGDVMTFPLVNPSNDHPLPLFAVASGPNATLTVALLFDDDDARF